MSAWWLRLLLVFTAPRPAFAALRDESDEAMQARSEPVLAVILLAGIAGVLATGPAGRLMDEPQGYDATLVAIWAFIGGGLYGMAAYFLGGFLLHFGGVALGSQGSYRRARHVLAFAAAPLALSLFLWPVRLALFGGDAFRSGGSDSGTAGAVFALLNAAFLAWTLALLVAGVRAVHGWTWPRAAGAVGLAAALPALVLVLAYAL